MARAFALNARVLPRDRSRLDVGLVAEHEERRCTPGARNATGLVRALYAREPHVVVHQELPRRGAVVGPRAMQFPIVVAVRRVPAGVEHGPVGDVLEQEIGVLGHVLRLVQRRHLEQSLLIALPGDIAQLARVAAAERDLAAAVQHLAADIVVLVDHQYVKTRVPRADRARQPGTPRADDQHVHLVVPLDAVGAHALRGCAADAACATTECSSADTGRHAPLKEISPTG